MKKSASNRVLRLAQAAALALTTLAGQAVAFHTGHLQATDPHAAAAELAETLGYEPAHHCQLIEQDNPPEQAPYPSFKLECPRTALLFKLSRQAADSSPPLTWEDLRPYVQPEQLAMIRKPLARFSFDDGQQGTGYFTVYSWVETSPWQDWMDAMGQRLQTAGSIEQQEQELARLHRMHQQMSRLFGGEDRLAGRVMDDGRYALQQVLSGEHNFYVRRLSVTPPDDLLVDPDEIVPAEGAEAFGWTLAELEALIGCRPADLFRYMTEETFARSFLKSNFCVVAVLGMSILAIPQRMVPDAIWSQANH